MITIKNKELFNLKIELIINKNLYTKEFISKKLYEKVESSILYKIGLLEDKIQESL